MENKFCIYCYKSIDLESNTEIHSSCIELQSSDHEYYRSLLVQEEADALIKLDSELRSQFVNINKMKIDTPITPLGESLRSDLNFGVEFSRFELSSESSDLSKFIIYTDNKQITEISIEMEFGLQKFFDYPVFKITDTLLQFKKLKHLDVHFNGRIVLFERFGELESLEQLSIYCSLLKTIPNSFSNLDQLNYFRLAINDSHPFGISLSETKIYGLGVKILSLKHMEVISELKNLEILNLYCTTIGSECVENITSLKELRLSGNILLTEKFGNLTNLEKLVFMDGKIYTKNKNDFELPSSFNKLINLEELSFRSSGLNSLPDNIGKLTKLKTLSIARTYNPITGSFIIPNSIGELEFLETFHIYGICQPIVFPLSFSDLNIRSLMFKSIQLGSNKTRICDQNIQIPNIFSDLDKLKEIIISKNMKLPKNFSKNVFVIRE